MIKFFRKIRQKLLVEGNLKKYLIYAIGEILLVVIGILIALQINNWNERNKQDVYVESLLHAIETNLINDIHGANARLQIIYEQDSLTNLVLTSGLTEGDYWNNPRLRFLIYAVEAPLYLSESIQSLLDREEELPAKYKPILTVAKRIEKRITAFNNAFSNLEDNVQQNFDFIATQMPGYIKWDSTTNAAKIDLYLNSEDYKTKVSRNWSIRNRLSRQASFIRYLSTKMLIEINSLEERMSAPAIKELLINLNLLPFHKVDCKDMISRSERNTEEAYLLMNLKENPVLLSLTYLDGYTPPNPTLRIEPFEIRSFPVGHRGLDGEYTQVVIQQQPNESGCISKYVSRRNGYLIIE